MCIAVVKPAEKIIDIDTLARCFQINSDGAGFSYPNGDEMVIVKGLMTFEEFKAKYEEHKMDHRKGMIHFRITTRGADGPDNTHPFPLKGGALVHNGTISGLGVSGSGKSDTALFAEMVHDMDAAQMQKCRFMIEKAVSGSRVAAMFASGETVIFNESSWVAEDGILYSNSGFRKPPASTFASSMSGRQGGSYAGLYAGLSDEDEYDFGMKGFGHGHYRSGSHAGSHAGKRTASTSPLGAAASTNVTHLTPNKKFPVVAGTHRDNNTFYLRYENNTFYVGYVTERKNSAPSAMAWLDVGLLAEEARLSATMAVACMNTSPQLSRIALISALREARITFSEMTRRELLDAGQVISSAGAAASSAPTADAATAVVVQ